MPRWLLLLLCALYVIPGLAGRDPWRGEDAAGFGVAWTMAQAPRGWPDVLWPNVLGMPITEEGPLPFWLGALAMRLLPWLAPDTVFQGMAMLWIVLLLVCTWYGAYLLARRPEVQPADPFGASATRSDYGRAVADSALLVTLATFGLLARVHETTAEAAQVAWVSLFLFGCALALERPRLGGAVAGLAIALTTLSRGLPPAFALSVAAVGLVVLVRPYRLIAGMFLGTCLALALVGSAIWPVSLWLGGAGGAAHLDGWLRWNGSLVAGPTWAALAYDAQNMPWFFWPAWPIALWAIWRWGGRRLEPALAVPGLSGAALLLVALAAPRGAEANLLPIVPPMALLAAFGLPTIRRGVISLIDWFAVMTFTLIGFVLWAYWIAFQTGWPPRMAFRIGQALQGFSPTFNALDLALGALATLAWLALVAWRVSRHPRALWRSMVLSAGGMVLAWFLLMTLWLPAANHRKTYRNPVEQAASVIDPGHHCVRALGLDATQRAMFGYYARMRFAENGQTCDWLLVADRVRSPLSTAPIPGTWQLAWRGQRPADRQERFRLYRRVAD